MSNRPNSEDMYREVDWMKPSDYPLLQELAKYDGWHTPKSLSLNLPNTRNWLGQRCRKLEEHDLVERHDDEPGYRITDRGRAFLAGELEPADLQEPDADAETDA
ncbi:hypothetical protein [Natrinema pallidum]|nr:hypothetical protein [Natrinema pallidum]